ncbi:MAG: Fic family protein [Verrucomicrobiota bacterium JB023]|nr:Fic family protein [Verrucomicrobiota bacterium JB023]
MSNFSREKPYNDLPALPPAADLESVPVLKAVTRAARALAELKGRTRTLPNPSILTSTIALQEAKASSEIENIVTTNDELYRGLSMETLGLSPHAKEVLHYNEALWSAAAKLSNSPLLTTNLFIEIVQVLKQNEAAIRSQPGTQIKNPTTGQIFYTPPEGEDLIRAKLADLERFLNEPPGDLDPLIRVALAHYQFEAIHPFYDGNGRTGRILIILYLLVTGLLEQPVLFLSRYIIEHKADYYQHLRQVTETESWENWLLYMLNGIEQTANDTSEKIRAISSLFDELCETGKERLSRPTYSKELIELLFYRPYCKIKFVQDAGLAKRATASRYLHELAEIGFVTPVKYGNELLFINHRLLEILGK